MRDKNENVRPVNGRLMQNSITHYLQTTLTRSIVYETLA